MDQKIFRSHTSVPDVRTRLYRGLLQEWVDLHHSPSTSAAVRRWGRREPVLKGYSTPGEVVDRIDQAPGPEKDEILLALIRLAQAGQQMAGRTVLQAMLPKLSRISRQAARPARWDEDVHHITIAEFWERLSDYPVERRPHRVAANLALDTLHGVTEPRRRPTPEMAVGLDHPCLTGGDDQELEVSPRLELRVDSDLPQLLAWARHTQLITAEESELLTTVYLRAERPGAGYAAVAEAEGVSEEALRKRCSRTVRRLSEAVRAELMADLPAQTTEPNAA